MIKPLIWKEWHEQRWKLAFGTLMLAFFTCVLISARLTTGNENIVLVIFGGGYILSLYSAMGVIAPEITDRTKIFLAAKPVKPWKVFLCKWFFGWLNFAVPILICGLVITAMDYFNADESLFRFNDVFRQLFAGIMSTTMFYSMICCFSPQKGGEASVGVTGLVILLFLCAHIVIIQITHIDIFRHQVLPMALKEIISFINPFMWIHFVKPVWGMSNATLFIEQGILFIVMLWLGQRKWQRSS